MLGLFVNTFTAEDKYSPLNREKRKTFSGFFSAVLKSKLYFELFQKKVDPHS